MAFPEKSKTIVICRKHPPEKSQIENLENDIRLANALEKLAKACGADSLTLDQLEAEDDFVTATLKINGPDFDQTVLADTLRKIIEGEQNGRD